MRCILNGIFVHVNKNNKYDKEKLLQQENL